MGACCEPCIGKNRQVQNGAEYKPGIQEREAMGFKRTGELEQIARTESNRQQHIAEQASHDLVDPEAGIPVNTQGH